MTWAHWLVLVGAVMLVGGLLTVAVGVAIHVTREINRDHDEH